jgi:hypothetical protein
MATGSSALLRTKLSHCDPSSSLRTFSLRGSWLVLDGAVGRHYQGTTLSTFVTFGTTITWPLFL